MTTTKRLIVLAGTLAQAKRHADAYGIPHALILWPRNLSDLDKAHRIPLFISPTLWSHPDAERLTQYAADRLELTHKRGTR